jgi:gas vesicle protein
LIHELQVSLVEQAALIAALGKELKTKVSSSDVDPAMKELNKDLGEAREFMKDVKSTTMEAWDKLQKESKEDLDKLKKKADEITKNLKDSLGLDK